MGQAVVHEDAPGKRKHLGLVLQAAERGREDQPVVVALEFGAVLFPFLVQVLKPEAFVR